MTSSKKITRYPYKLRDYGLSGHNEPPQSNIIEVNVRNYPDMYRVYQRFAQVFNVKMNQFILGNGAENVIKNVLLTVKPKTLSWNYPTWNMLEVYCEALNIKPDAREFKLINSNCIKGIQPSFYEQEKVDCYYTNLGRTSVFEYHCYPSPQAKTYICDCTYMPLKELETLIPQILKEKNSILVGSLGKIYGAGLRLGFAIFNEFWNEKMQIQREQFLNPAACEYILNNPQFGKQPESLWFKEIEKYFPIDFCSLTNNYFTLKGHIEANPGLNPHYFKVKEVEFTKFGIPSNMTELQVVTNILEDYRREHFKEFESLTDDFR